MPTKSDVTLIKSSFCAIVALVLLFGANVASAQIWPTLAGDPDTDHDRIYLNMEFSGDTQQRVSFRQISLMDTPLAANFNENSTDVAIQSLSIAAFRYTGTGVPPEVSIENGIETCILVSAPDSDNNSFSDGKLEIDVIATNQNGVSESITLRSITGGGLDPQPPDCQEAAPVANSLNFSLDEDAGPYTLNIGMDGVDVRDPNAIRSIVPSVLPAAVEVVSTSGGLTFMVPANYSIPFDFTYDVAFSNFSSNAPSGEVSVTFNPMNDAPTAFDDPAAGTVIEAFQNIPIQINNLLANDTDPDGDNLTISDMDSDSASANGGTITYANSVATYTPPGPPFTGPDTFQYVAMDELDVPSNAATVTVNVLPNAAPTANSFNDATAEDTLLTITVAELVANGNVMDPEGEALVFSFVDVASTEGGTVEIINNGDALTYLPPASFASPPNDTFTYRVFDGTSESDPAATVTIDIGGVNDAPTAVDDPNETTMQNVPKTLNVLANDTDPEGDPLTVASVTQGNSGGSIVNNGGNVTYTPALDFVGVETFTYIAQDDSLLPSLQPATVTVTVTANSAPVAVDDTAVTDEDVSVTVDVLANDSDPQSDGLTISDVTDGANGTVINNGSDVTYTPNAGFFGSDTFTYDVSDGTLTDTATVTVTVNEVVVNGAPSGQDDVRDAEQGTAITINVLINDFDPDRDALGVASVTQPANGMTTINNVDPNSGLGTTITYTPNAGFFGTDVFTYEVSDGTLTDTATVTINVAQRFLLESIAETPNQLTVARTVDNVCPRLGQNANNLVGDQNDLLAKCSNLIGNEDDPDAQRKALDEISGHEISAQQTTGIDFTQVQLSNVGARMRALKQGVRGNSFAGLQLYHEGEYIPAAQFAAMVKDLAGGGSGDEDSGQPLESRWGFFGRGKINVGEKDASDNEAGFDFDAWGVTLGVDYRVTDNFVFGIAGGFNSGETEFHNNGGEMESDGTSAHLFGVVFGEHAYFDFVASFGQLDYDSVRNINYTDISGPVNETAIGTTEGDVTAIGVSFGYEFNKGAWSFTPNISATTIEVDVDAFSETGAGGLDLSFGKQNAKSSAFEGGLRVSYTASKDWGVLIPELRVGFVKENDNDSEVINVQFVNDPFANDPSQPSPGITLITDDPDDSYLRWGLALNAQFKSGLSGFVDYETLSGLNLVTSHEFTVGLRFQRQFR